MKTMLQFCAFDADRAAISSAIVSKCFMFVLCKVEHTVRVSYALFQKKFCTFCKKYLHGTKKFRSFVLENERNTN